MRLSHWLLCLVAAMPSAACGRPLVAVIDSGVARTTELRQVLLAEYDMASPAARPSFRPRYDHGTMVATILSREARGQVDIVSLRIDDPAGCPAKFEPPCQASAVPIVKAIDKAVALHVDAINISLSLRDDPRIADAIAAAARSGILVVLAAGNQGLNHPGNLAMARAGFPRAVLVGALDGEGHPWTGTNRPEAGPQSAYQYVWRRGVDVATQGAEGLAVTATGTSFATPIETARRVLAVAAIRVRMAKAEHS
jgi:subtilisin family serine protease